MIRVSFSHGSACHLCAPGCAVRVAVKLLGAMMFYLVLGLLFLAVIAAGIALSIDLSQFRYTVF